MIKNNIDIILKSNNIFTGISDKIINGYVAISGNKIVAVEEGDGYKELLSNKTNFIDLGENVISPGFVDTHTFFTGYIIFNIGVDVSKASSIDECIEILKKYESTLDNNATIFGHGWNPEAFKSLTAVEKLDEIFINRRVIVFSNNRDTCLMNTKAIEVYKFTPDECYPEAYWRIMREYLNDRNFIDKQFKDYMQMMNSRGVTAVKEMGFDDYYGFTDYLEEVEKNNLLSLRISFMSQPVGQGINIPYGLKMREKFSSDFIRFSGFNRMTDGTVASLKADLLKPYECLENVNCIIDIDYDLIEKEVLLADEHNFRYSLHAQGDGAVHKVLNIYEKCKRGQGKCINRHAITDMEFTHPDDLERMGKLGIIAEIYPQIMSLDLEDETKEMIEKNVGLERGKYFWNRRKMLDSGVVVSCGTDLPLMITNIPESIYHACGGYFADGKDPYNKQNTMSIVELLKAWTIGGQYNCGFEDKLGTLEVGKLADIAVLNRNIFETPVEEMKDVEICLTIVDGKIVYNKL
ncbi:MULTISPECIES: amidohydrolase family protein [unclassified Clostridium]|uniref:amidohydrolase n=1 Tax=unclassified Clostridium TaxID=2614128 RepID=UPI000298006F|nr:MULTISPECIES: amidohydrolase family protein [unclassified Clostridium]EKQ57472.1 MAG: putative TIM-barrel fold metal-dependent hydrolase [Clostridium sp. Maddingley MBC34-26]